MTDKIEHESVCPECKTHAVRYFWRWGQDDNGVPTFRAMCGFCDAALYAYDHQLR
jgi:hypothetical protein